MPNDDDCPYCGHPLAGGEPVHIHGYCDNPNCRGYSDTHAERLANIEAEAHLTAEDAEKWWGEDE